MRWRFVIPLSAFAVIAAALVIGLTLRPHDIPSALIGHPVPEFDLPAVQGRSLGLSSADLRRGEPVLVNVFASWCIPCREEHPLLMELTRGGRVMVYGINQRDDPANAERWLATFGDPYRRTGADLSGRVSIDWGVYGVPETFVVDGSGCIQFKLISVLTRDIFEREIVPRLRGERKVSCSG
ncbi:MAG: DsbE family thiol:disulfide interchange protein [Alphaproteobacteria bacterium]|nr:DsbE family thiol:disulfide interchange protein [Alphaproteobacteria bacterium]